MNQAHDRTDDTDGRRIAAHALEHLGSLDIAAFLGVEIHFEDAADGFRFGTVDQQLQALARVRIGLGIGHAFQAQQAFLACGHTPVDHPVDTASQVDTRRKKNPAHDLQRPLEGTHG
ncbi:hypothetical protein D3C79_849600 [compost metagenome]